MFSDDPVGVSAQVDPFGGIVALETKSGSEIAVVTLPKLPPETTAKEFATALFNHWGIGKKGQDNGVLFLVSIGDRRTEIETGYGVESLLPDARVGRILDSKVIPYFKQGNYDRGILEGTLALANTLERGGKQSPISSFMDAPGGLKIGMISGLFIALISLFTKRSYSRQPIFIEPEGYTRIEGLSDDRKAIYILSGFIVLGIALISVMVIGVFTNLESFDIFLSILFQVFWMMFWMMFLYSILAKFR